MSIGAAVRRVVDGVLDEVAEDVVQLRRIDDERAGVGCDVDAQLLLLVAGVRLEVRHEARDRAPSTSHVANSGSSCPASSRARRSRSLTSRSMRVEWRWMISRNLAGFGVVGLVDQRLGVALDGGQRRAQLVRDVGDEVAADLIGAAQVGDVVEDEHGAAAGGDHRRDARDERAADVAGDRQLEACGLLAGQHARAADRRCPDGGWPRRRSG